MQKATAKKAKNAPSLAPKKRPRKPKPRQPSPFECTVSPPGWNDEEPIFNLEGLRPDIATAVMMQHVLARHFWGQITIRGYSVSAFARKLKVSPPDLWYFFNGHRLVRFATIAAIYSALPEEAWPDMVVVEAKVGIIRNRSEKWMADQK